MVKQKVTIWNFLSDSPAMARSPFGERLKRAFNNATNQQIAERLGTTAPAVQHYVNGRVPNGEILARIASVTKCNLHWLLTGEGPERIGEANLSEELIFDLRVLERRMREIAREELRNAMVPTQDLGTVDEFDLAAAVREDYDPGTILKLWMQHDHMQIAENFEVHPRNWESLSFEERIEEIKGLRGIIERQREREKNYAPKATNNS